MPRNSSGIYTLPPGNPVIAGTAIETNWANPTMADIGAEISNSLDRDGRGAMRATFKLVDGVQNLPALTFGSALGTGIFKTADGFGVSILASLVASWAPAGMTLPAGKSITIGGAPVITEAPIDGGYYARRNAAWEVQVPISSVSAGMVIDYAGVTPPTGYLLCDGTSYPTATYPTLFAAIGYVWGGAGASFNVPDLRRRVTMGSGGTQVSGPINALGAVGGAETHALATGEGAVHSHGYSDPGHAHTQGLIQGGWTSGGGIFAISGGAGSVSMSYEGTGISIQNSAGGAAHNNVQPSAVMNKIIKT